MPPRFREKFRHMQFKQMSMFFNVVLAAMSMAFSSSSPEAMKSAPNLLLVSIDTLRADRLGCYGYKKVQTPHIDRLAMEGVRFATAVSPVPLTLPSHCTILTGTYPPYHGVRDNVGYKLAESRTTLAEILKKQGYRTAAFIAAFVLNAKFGLHQGFDLYDDRIAGSSRPGPVINLNAVERTAGEVVSRTIEWVKAGSSSPFFLWVHLFDPHDPYEPPSDFRKTYGDRPYDGEIAYADQELGKLLSLLRQKHMYENTIIVLLGDHGESFGEHQEWTHGYFIYDTTLLVPLIIKPAVPGFAGKVVTEQVSLADVVPTILQLLRLPGPTELQGRGMLDLMKGKTAGWPGAVYCESHYPAQFGWSPLVGLRRRDAKYIRAAKAELYRLQEDPGEKSNRFFAQPEMAKEMQAAITKLESLYADPSAGKTSRTSMDPRRLDALRSLGYVGSPVVPSLPAKDEGKPGGADPKDKLPVYQMISAGSQDVAAGRYRQAIPVFQKVLLQEPGMRLALSMLGRCHFETGRFEEARKAFQEILKGQPANPDARFYLAACDYRQKNWTEAEAGFKRLLQENPDFVSAHLYLGFLYQTKKDTDSALASFQRALALDPENEDAHAKTGFLLASRGKVTEAVPHFQKVIELNPGDAEAHSNLATAYRVLGHTGQARKEQTEACRLDKSYCPKE